jgi:alkanesulfonate monooxygenase SsuD/methylene tetrahydromethanopterin reductase-like flavin-dependent oxidoreductase (luciferase family)
VLLATKHGPLTLARTGASLDRCSGGPLDPPIGLRNRDVAFDALGLRRDRRGRRVEALEVMPAVLAGATLPHRAVMGIPQSG